ncbi:DNA/RNA nuclease SfsA [Desulfatitalea alkaliphila]|uniref:Sugar fermentation stimulation protein homolog n=1 Tax=Desulfatitalea alkaliphila TaxID=2929485 RepID=A0AA41R071_9BACT|nr:DNA/RNA nuclease SfsA [Desulfatitalea alkaliphila]MCJ8499146.1 DNA/RNA nuclease SfsA [Desulfatitalea alkaliphila]
MPQATPNAAPATAALEWPPLVRGRLIKRYKRFLADVELDDGRAITAHCPNSGSMTGCKTPGQPVFLSQNDNPKRKLKFTWHMIEMPTSLVGINTQVPNRLVTRSITAGCIDALQGYEKITAEVTVNTHSRLDLKLTGPEKPDCYVEIKNCTLVEEGVALFPDAPTARGRKHLQELIRLKAAGHRAVIFFLVQRTDARAFAPAVHIDPEYGRGLWEAADAGVEILVYDVIIDPHTITLNKPLPYDPA